MKGMKLMTKGFDLSSSPNHRLIKHYILSRLIPMGNYNGGAGMKCLLVFAVTHYCGRPVFFLITRFERLFARIYRLF